MKISYTILTVFLVFLSCNNSQKSSEVELIDEKDSLQNLDIRHQIANANGYENWKDVSELAFTFNVDRGENHFDRAWIWKPKTGSVSMISATDTIHYNRSKMDSIVMKTDAAFINDKYWLLAPFQLLWDKGITFSEKENAVAPISKDTLAQLTIVYGNDGGYTPGDAYDFFYDHDFKIKEWNYRKGNTEAPSMSTTWEDYENFSGIEIAKMHKDSTGGFKLYFSNISVKKETAN
ncbi:MAG TPA: hypothetical protein PKH16_09525 [Aequorivita sp.]|jgi:hypothetical protein|nr:hypothetical protein [Aequorivita sp.]HNP68131.1 hypothetical protein [Aequorivita sp.]|tara:strand:- start:109284 stop:109985 length:702 start_codon:yes stop_codon:yes gene_type:complete